MNIYNYQPIRNMKITTSSPAKRSGSGNRHYGWRAAGFTIVELMIAAAIFSLVLILLSYGVIRFNQAYYGGLVQSSTQNAARSIIDNISQAIQLDGGTISPDLTKPGLPGWTGLC